MRSFGRWLAFVALAVLSGTASAQIYSHEELRIPAPGAGSRGLEAMLVKADLPGRLPLVVISHGTPSTMEAIRSSTPLVYLRPAVEFARRGWAVAIVMRRGYGDSGGNYAEGGATCENPDYLGPAAISKADLRASITHLQQRPDIDGSRVLVVGQSTGGYAAVALGTDPPSGLLAGISFAGGRIAATKDGRVCSKTEDHLVAAFASLGKRSRVPMLWVYSQNDRLFPPALVQRLKDAYSTNGGNVELVMAPANGADGHGLFIRGIQVWTPYVDNFLKQRGLVWRETLLPPPPQPKINPPPQLTAAGRPHFERFLSEPLHRAFAISPTGAFAWRSGQRTIDAARKSALEICTKHGPNCRVVIIDDKAVP